jgi:glutamate synthase domain-containing protein 3
MERRIDALLRDGKVVVVDTFEDMEPGENIVKIEDFEDVRDIYARVREYKDEVERRKIQEILNYLKNYRTVFVEGYPRTIIRKLAEMGFAVFSFERIEDAPHITYEGGKGLFGAGPPNFAPWVVNNL